MDIYIDIALMQEVLMNYLILLVTAKFLKSRTTNLRLFLGSLVAGLDIVVLLLLPGMRFYYTAAAKIIFSLFIITVAFAPEKIMSFFKTLAVFYLVTFIFGGAGFAFLYFNGNGGIVKNGVVVVFGRSNKLFLFLSTITAILMIRIFWEIIQNKFVKENLLISLKITFESKAINVDALVDTGNSLHDPLTNMPVVVAEFRAIKDLLPQEIRNIFEEEKEKDLNSVTNIVAGTSWFSRFRLIPFTSLGKENGMLIGFKPDYIEIEKNDEKKGVSNVIIGIYNRSLSKNETYKALLSPELVA